MKRIECFRPRHAEEQQRRAALGGGKRLLDCGKISDALDDYIRARFSKAFSLCLRQRLCQRIDRKIRAQLPADLPARFHWLAEYDAGRAAVFCGF